MFLDRRTTKTVNGTATSFLHDNDNEIAEYDGAGALVTRYVPGPAIDDTIAVARRTTEPSSTMTSPFPSTASTARVRLSQKASARTGGARE